MKTLTFHIQICARDCLSMWVDSDAAVLAGVLREHFGNEQRAGTRLNVVRQAEVLVLSNGLVVVEPGDLRYGHASNFTPKLDLFSIHHLE